MSTITRDQLKAAYLLAYDNFATDATEVADHLYKSGLLDESEPNLAQDRKSTTAVLRKLERSGLLCGERVNGEKTLTWQCYETYDYISREEALELFNSKFPEELEPTTDDRNHATGPRYTDEQLARAAELRNTTDQSWAKIAAELGIKTPYRLAKKVRAAGFEVR